jgi:hypothetical protein
VSDNPYLTQIQQTLPRLLALFDSDRTSQSYGMGDRYYWAWGLIDFGNGTFQGAAHGLARLWRHGLWPYATLPGYFLQRINMLFQGAATLTRNDGSLEEAFPNEGSYCVTALVAFDLLCALDLLRDEIDSTTQARWIATVQPMIGYLIKADETHAIISNHLATAVAALVRWHHLTQDASAETRARELLDSILGQQSSEGWFREYEGADPGYQSLCAYYLADVHRLRADWNLTEPLRKSIRFLWHFAHPDGSFGGLYGSRCTRFYYPAGVLALANEIPEAAVLANYMATSIENQTVVTLLAMDEPNLVPMFNAYCWAAALANDGNRLLPAEELELPALSTKALRQYYPQAGLLVDRGERHYTIVSIHKGGVVSHFVADRPPVHNDGIVVRNPSGRFGSSQAYAANNKAEWQGDRLIIEAAIAPMPKQLTSPLQFLALRTLCISAFRFTRLRERVKQRLVRLLITGTKPWPARNLRTIYLGPGLTVIDAPELPSGYQRVDHIQSFVPIHMASQGYWQRQDEGETQ